MLHTLIGFSCTEVVARIVGPHVQWENNHPLLGKCVKAFEVSKGFECPCVGSSRANIRGCAFELIIVVSPVPYVEILHRAGLAYVALSPTVQMKVKMEDMAQEFGDMLKETLDRMRERIEVRQRPIHLLPCLWRDN